jgi:UDP-N-acetylmuramate--alanine ligase
MSALARILLQRGEHVRGSDRAASALLEELEKEGAEVHIGHDAKALQEGDTVVYSSSIDEANEEFQRAKKLGAPLLHRSEMLHRLMETQKPLLVTGSHGKTTTTALLASILLEASLDPSFVVGGLLLKTKSNGRFGKGPYFVAEADESDGSFLKTPAFGAIITNLGNDHLNFWKSEERLAEAFSLFFRQVKNEKHLFWCGDNSALRALTPSGFSYGFSEHNDYRITNFKQNTDGIVFDLNKHKSIKVALFGKHNALNSAAAFALALSLGIDEGAIRTALASFRGTHRRLERVAEVQKIEIYDDYGHHPTEIAATLAALRSKAKERRIVAIFQPHRYSRLSTLFDHFLTSFKDADELIVTDVYSAGEPAGSVTAQNLFDRLRETWKERVHFIPKEELAPKCAELLCIGDIAITLGAGDIFKTARILPDYLKEKKLRVGVLFGGPSPEHEISVLSARNVIAALDPQLYQTESFFFEKTGYKISQEFLTNLSRCDLCFPVLHGPQGEDGALAAFLKLLGIPYVGCDHDSAALCMQKSWTKQIALCHEVPTSPFIEFNSARWRSDSSALKELTVQKLSYPVWVKPVHLGSSIGVTRVEKEEDLESAAALAFQYDDYLIVEQEIVGRQIEFAVLGNDDLRVGAAGEILNHGQFYDYERKYGPQSSKTQTPAALTPEEETRGKELALKMYEACGCRGLSRVDFFLDSSGTFWLNEINPMPGFTAISLYPKMWEAEGLTQRELMNELIILALHRHRVLK